MDIIGLIGYDDQVSMTLITMQAEAPNESVPPLPHWRLNRNSTRRSCCKIHCSRA